MLLLGLWLLPISFAPSGMTEGIDLFFISGVMIVLAGVWIIIYNSDLLLGAVVGLFGWLRGMPPVLRAAVSYPMQSRFRTGMTLAMFSLVVFTIVTMSFITAAFGSIFEDTDRLSGGFDVRADAGYAAPIPDMNEALKDKKGVNADDFTAVGTLTGLSVDAKQKDTSRKPQSLFLQGVDGGYTKNVGYGFKSTVAEYDTANGLDRAEDREGHRGYLVGSRAKQVQLVGDVEPQLKLSGFYGEDPTLPDDLYIQVEDPQTGRTRNLHVIGVLEDTAFFAPGVTTSRATVDDLAGSPLAAQSYQFRLADGVDPVAVAKDLEKAFAQNGLQAVVIENEIEEGSATQGLFNNLLMGFMGLGLLVGIAALGVIAARSVVEKAADRDAPGSWLPAGTGAARFPYRVVFRGPARHRTRCGSWRGALRRDRRLFRGAGLRNSLHGAMEHPGRYRRPRLLRLAAHHLPPRQPGLQGLSCRSVALRVERPDSKGGSAWTLLSSSGPSIVASAGRCAVSRTVLNWPES